MCWGRRPQLPKCWRRAASCAAGRVVPGTGPGPVHVLGSAPPAAHVLASRRQLRGRERPSMAGSILSWAGPSGRAPCILCSQHAGVGTGCSPTAAALLLQLCSCSVEEQVIHVSNQLHWQWTPVTPVLTAGDSWPGTPAYSAPSQCLAHSTKFPSCAPQSQSRPLHRRLCSNCKCARASWLSGHRESTADRVVM